MQCKIKSLVTQVATIVSNMNPGINATTDSEEVMLLQQALLWMLYDAGHLTKYPMAIGKYHMQASSLYSWWFYFLCTK